MADVLAPTTTRVARMGEGKERSGLRRALRKWKDRLKGSSSRPSTSTSTSTSAPQTTSPPPLPQPQHKRIVSNAPAPSTSPASPPPPDILFAPTTETTISSPFDPRNVSNPGSNTSSPHSTLRKRNSRLMRRNTAPADYFSDPRSESNAEAADTVVPMNTITTTITATHAPPKRPRYRLSLSKRSSSQSFLPSFHPPLASPAPSAPNPAKHTNQRTMYQFTTAAEIAERVEKDKDILVQAAEVIRRDKPKDWMDPAWREKEAKGLERAAIVRNSEMLDASRVRLGKDGTDQGR